MGIRGYTKNYKLIKPEYNTDTYHDYEYDNLDTIDAVLSAIYASGDWQGFWTNNTSYKAGSIVIDRDTDTMYKVLVEHVTDSESFNDFYTAHPDYYRLWSPNNLAEDWAIKMDGAVETEEYSAKAHASSEGLVPTGSSKEWAEQSKQARDDIFNNENFNTVSSNISNVNTVGQNISSVIVSANISSDIVTCSENIEAIKDAPNQANLASESATAAQDSATVAQDSATVAQSMATQASKSATVSAESAQEAEGHALHASRRNVGDVFYTTRLDTALNGAVECNGAQYNVADFTGSHTVPALLADGKLPYVSIEAFDAAVAANGSCRAWGWDGSDATVFKVPKLNDVYIMAGTAASVGEFINESLPNIKSAMSAGIPCAASGQTVTGAFTTTTKNDTIQGAAATNNTWINGFDASLSSSVYQDGAKVRPDSVRYRAMVQVATGIIDEALETVTSAQADIAALGVNKANTSLDNLTAAASANLNTQGIRTVIETYRNGTEWYRVFSDGWKEQGGFSATHSYIVNFLKPFTDASYTALCTFQDGYSTNSLAINSRTNSGFIINRGTSATDIGAKAWFACGY